MAQIPESAAKRQVEESPFAQAVLKHWQEFRPRMCRELEQQGKLYPAVWAAATRTLELMQTLTCAPNNLPYDRAQEIVYPQWYRLPDEEDQPSLTFDPSSLEPSTEIFD